MSTTETLGERLEALEAGQARIEAQLTQLLERLPQEQITQATDDIFNTNGTLKQLVEVYRNMQRDMRNLETAIRLTLAQAEAAPEGTPHVKAPRRRQLTAVD